MFRGQSNHSIDQKGRISLPARFREQLEKGGDFGLILTPAPFEPCLHLYSLKDWEAYEEKISQLPMHSRQIVRFRRLYISPAVEVELDKAGRIRVPADFRQKAQLEKEARWAGMGVTAELWAQSLFEEANAISAEELADFREQIQELV